MIEALILAAGSSIRMGEQNKLTLPWKESTMIRTSVNAALESHVDRVIVVTGHQHGEVKRALQGLPIDIVHNPTHRLGQVGSIQAGVSMLSQQMSTFLVCLGDMPRLTSALINKVIDSHLNENFLITRPVNDHQVGHPVIMNSSLREQVLAYTDAHTMRPFMKARANQLQQISTQESGYFMDIDTPSDYQKWSI
ncbi:MAG: nucleotidyltransferase family protein [Bacteroidota bacterium]